MRYWKEETGGVTLILLVVLVSLFVVHIVFIDLLRYRMAVSEGESITRSAGRSALSQFEPELLTYGLFGADGSEQTLANVLNRIQEVKISESEIDSAFHLYDVPFRAEHVKGEPLYHLGDHVVFHRQVLERMKYIAGIEFGFEVSHKFVKTREQVQQTKDIVTWSKELDELLRQRESELDGAWSTAQSLAHSALSGVSSGSLQTMIDGMTVRLNRASEFNEEIRERLNGAPQILIYPSSYFSSYIASAGTIASMRTAFERVVAAGNAKGAALLQGQMNEYVSNWLAMKREEEARRQSTYQSELREQGNQKRNVAKEIEKGRSKLINVCRPSDADQYKSLEQAGGLFGKYTSYNGNIDSGGMYQNISMGNPDDFMDTSFELLDVLSEAAVTVRDEVFVNEYALTHFTYRTYNIIKDTTAMQSKIGNRDYHHLQEQEAEYILYGLPSCQLNVGAAYTEMFVFRTALRTMESLMKPKAASVHPMLQLLTALAEGAKAANEDMDVLLDGGLVTLPFIQGVTMSYKDHLRLFYLLHSREASVLSRMQALIELNTGIDLMDKYTAFRFRYGAPQVLWRLPIQEISAESVVSYD